MNKKTITAHPGDILLDVLNKKGLKKMAFARQAKITESRLSEILHGKKGMTEDIALKLEEHLGIAADFWMKAQRNYDYCHDISAIRMR